MVKIATSEEKKDAEQCDEGLDLPDPLLLYLDVCTALDVDIELAASVRCEA